MTDAEVGNIINAGGRKVYEDKSAFENYVEDRV